MAINRETAIKKEGKKRAKRGQKGQK